MAGFSSWNANADVVEQKYIGDICVTGRGAFERLATVRFSLLASLDASAAQMQICEDGTDRVTILDMKLVRDRFEISVPMAMLCGDRAGGLFYYKYRMITVRGSYDMICDENGSFRYREANEEKGNLQLLVYQRRRFPPKWLYGGVIYQIFPDRFFRAGSSVFDKTDACLCRDISSFPSHFCDREENKKNRVFWGGDLQGIVEKLEYLASLGVTCLYLNPIFSSPSNHRYDTADYNKIDSLLGGDEALESLVNEAKKHGISVLLDGVFNHTGSDSVYFNACGTYPSCGAAQSQDSLYYSWYSFRSFPESYESWWGVKTLPRVRCDHASYRAFLFEENGIVRKWMRKGIAGWRIDVADELSDDFLRQLSLVAREEKSDAVIIGEVWEDASNKISYQTRRKYLQGEELDSVMNSPIRTAIIASLTRRDFMQMKRTLETIYGHYPPEAANAAMNILSTHDTERILTALGGEREEDVPYALRAQYRMDETAYMRARALLHLAVGIQMTLPGVPCIYYGDERGMQGFGDPFCRMPLDFENEDASLLSFYRKMGRVRQSEPIFAEGEFSLVHVDADILCFERTGMGEKLVVVVNVGPDIYEFRSEHAKELISQEEGSVLEISPLSVAIMKLGLLSPYSAYIRMEKNGSNPLFSLS